MNTVHRGFPVFRPVFGAPGPGLPLPAGLPVPAHIAALAGRG
ncbi:hypothetical protein ACF068_25135 [Streptomyces sp. NPDC016309]